MTKHNVNELTLLRGLTAISRAIGDLSVRATRYGNTKQLKSEIAGLKELARVGNLVLSELQQQKKEGL